MAFEFVNAWARIRELAGLSCILYPHPVEHSAKDAEKRPAPEARLGVSQSQGRPWQGRAAGMGDRSAGTSGSTPVSRPVPGPRFGSGSGAVSSQAQTRPSMRPGPAPVRQAPAQATARPQPAPVAEAHLELVATWPEGWQKLFARTRPGKVAWTYYGLGHDLCGQANKARSKKLSELIAYLAMPRGTHTFWPIGLPALDEDGNTILAIDRKIFWQGLQLLNARMLIIMGSPAARAVGIQGPISPTMPMRPINGMLTLLTWDIDDLDNEDHFSRTRNYLRQTLTPLVC